MAKQHTKPLPFLVSSTLLLFLALMATPSRLADARGLTQSERDNLDLFINKVMRCANIHALGLSLVGDGEVVYETGYGLAHLVDANAPMNANKDTVFCLGSSTQAFTSVLLADLLARNKNYTFDTPLSEILGARVDLPGYYRSRFANLKDILGMRTGLSKMDILVDAMGVNRRDLLHKLRYAPEVKNFREDNVFSEIPFALAEDVAKTLGKGSTWAKQMRRRIFQRLGMRSTGFVHLDTSRNPNWASPVVTYDDKTTSVPRDAYKGQELTAAASSVCASAADMSKWIYFILSKGMLLDGTQVMTEEDIESTFQAVQSRGSGMDTRASGFTQPNLQVAYTRDSNALGWIKGQYRGFSFVSQDGSLPGYQSLTTILHKRNVGVFTAFTGDGGPLAYAAKVLINIYALDLLLHGKPWFDQHSVCNILPDLEEMTEEGESKSMRRTVGGQIASPIRTLDEYEGTFRNYAFGDVIVKNESNILKLSYGDHGTYNLYPLQMNDTFKMEAEGSMWFSTGADTYRGKGPYLAMFSSRDDDPQHRIDSITIPHFDSDTDPVFSLNPVPPRSEDYAQTACKCSACALVTTSASVLAASILVALVGRWL